MKCEILEIIQGKMFEFLLPKNGALLLYLISHSVDILLLMSLYLTKINMKIKSLIKMHQHPCKTCRCQFVNLFNINL